MTKYAAGVVKVGNGVPPHADYIVRAYDARGEVTWESWHIGEHSKDTEVDILRKKSAYIDVIDLKDFTSERVHP